MQNLIREKSIMGKTSTEVKRRYNEKTYTRWAVDLRNEDFEKIEQCVEN